jgi:hypothetical protein
MENLVDDLKKKIDLRRVLEHIVQVASGEKQVATDDTAGMAYIDKYARAALKAVNGDEVKTNAKQ